MHQRSWIIRLTNASNFFLVSVICGHIPLRADGPLGCTKMPGLRDVSPGGSQISIGYEVTERSKGSTTILLNLGHINTNRRGRAQRGEVMILHDAACTRAGAVSMSE